MLNRPEERLGLLWRRSVIAANSKGRSCTDAWLSPLRLLSLPVGFEGVGVRARPEDNLLVAVGPLC